MPVPVFLHLIRSRGTKLYYSFFHLFIWSKFVIQEIWFNVPQFSRQNYICIDCRESGMKNSTIQSRHLSGHSEKCLACLQRPVFGHEKCEMVSSSRLLNAACRVFSTQIYWSCKQDMTSRALLYYIKRSPGGWSSLHWAAFAAITLHRFLLIKHPGHSKLTHWRTMGKSLCVMLSYLVE